VLALLSYHLRVCRELFLDLLGCDTDPLLVTRAQRHDN